MAVEVIPLELPDSIDHHVYKEFGREIKGLDVANMTADDFKKVERLLYEHDLLVFRNCDLSPREQYTITKAFDPSSELYGHGNQEVEKFKSSILRSLLTTLPDVPQVQLIGNGALQNHEGISDITLKHPSHKTFHKTCVSAEDESHGITRFYRWHMDAALYGFAPPKVTTLYGLQVPDAAMQTCRYDDGSGDELQVALGATAFVSGKVMFELLSPDLKSLAVRTQVQYAPHPFVWMSQARAMSTGLGLETEGKEVPLAELPQWDESEVQVLPLVWKNQLTKKLHLQAHPCAAIRLIIDPVSEPDRCNALTVPYPSGAEITNLKEVRDILYTLQRPAISPQYVYPHSWHKKDFVIFHNRGVLHSALGTFKDDQIRVFHQCNLAASDYPVGPDAEDMRKWV